MNRKRKKNRYKWGHVGKLGKRSLEEVASGLITYMELAKAARKYLKATKRFNQRIDFRLSIEIDFCMYVLLYLFKVTKAFVRSTQDMILLDKEEFKEQVKKFSDGIIPEAPVVITKNLVGEMAQIIQRDKNLGRKIIK
jgi:hypothetical protein